jgi:hypothetical protein
MLTAHNDFPLAPQHLTISAKMLSPFSPVPVHWSSTEKLAPNLRDKQTSCIIEIESFI